MVARAILFCGRQCIAHRGDSENFESSGNPGNFRALLQLFTIHDDVLRHHLESRAMRCVTHLSPQTQNELIAVMGKHIVLKGILNEIITARYYSVLTDEVTSHNVDHFALCVKFFDGNKNIREEFLKFLELERITGSKIGQSILELVEICVVRGTMVPQICHQAGWEFRHAY